MPPRVGQVLMGLIRTPLLCTFQSVAQVSASNGEETGRPEFQRKMPDICQPPSRVLTTPPELPNQRCPRPKGICQTPLMLMMCLTSKSETE